LLQEVCWYSSWWTTSKKSKLSTCIHSLESFVIVVDRAIDSLADGKRKKEEAPKKEEPA
jgi:hypothetical protein